MTVNKKTLLEICDSLEIMTSKDIDLKLNGMPILKAYAKELREIAKDL